MKNVDQLAYMFLESFHESFKLLFTLSQTGRHLLKDLFLGVLAEPAARLQHLINVLLLHTPHPHLAAVTDYYRLQTWSHHFSI